jgi:hypothetical protein
MLYLTKKKKKNHVKVRAHSWCPSIYQKIKMDFIKNQRLIRVEISKDQDVWLL